MALTSTTLQPQTAEVPVAPSLQPDGNSLAASLISLIFVSVYAGKKSRRQLRRIKRQMAWLLFRQKVRSIFSGMSASDRKILLYILLAIAFTILAIYHFVAALVLALVFLILLLTGTIHF